MSKICVTHSFSLSCVAICLFEADSNFLFLCSFLFTYLFPPILCLKNIFAFALWHISFSHSLQSYLAKWHLCFRNKGTSPFFWKELLLSRQRIHFYEAKKIWELKEISFTDADLFGFCSVNRVVGHSCLLVTIFSLHSVTPRQTHWLKVKSGSIWCDYTLPQSLYRQSAKRYTYPESENALLTRIIRCHSIAFQFFFDFFFF